MGWQGPKPAMGFAPAFYFMYHPELLYVILNEVKDLYNRTE